MPQSQGFECSFCPEGLSSSASRQSTDCTDDNRLSLELEPVFEPFVGYLKCEFISSGRNLEVESLFSLIAESWAMYTCMCIMTYMISTRSLERSVSWASLYKKQPRRTISKTWISIGNFYDSFGSWQFHNNGLLVLKTPFLILSNRFKKELGTHHVAFRPWYKFQESRGISTTHAMKFGLV